MMSLEINNRLQRGEESVMMSQEFNNGDGISDDVTGTQRGGVSDDITGT